MTLTQNLYTYIYGQKTQASRFNQKVEAGVSLIEAAAVLMFFTIALIPIVNNIGGPGSATGTAVKLTGEASKEILLANTLSEKALSSDYSAYTCNGVATNEATLSAIPSETSINIPSSGRCSKALPDNNTLYYNWTIYNATPGSSPSSTSIMPVGNKLYNAVLNVYNTQSGGTPIFTAPISFFLNKYTKPAARNKTAILIVQDKSKAMRYGGSEESHGEDDDKDEDKGKVRESDDGSSDDKVASMSGSVASPFLKYRYDDTTPNTYLEKDYDPTSVKTSPPYTNNSTYKIADLYKNNTLDIVSAKASDLTETPWDDRYLGKRANRAPDCSTEAAIKNFVTAPINGFYADNGGVGLAADWSYDGRTVPGSYRITNIYNICARTPNFEKRYISRIEASRTALLSFLISMESNPGILKDTQMGLELFSSDWWTEVPFENADSTGHYVKMRRRISWINREDDKSVTTTDGNFSRSIVPGGARSTYGALKYAAEQILKLDDVDHRIIILVSGGKPEEKREDDSCKDHHSDEHHDDTDYSDLAEHMGDGSMGNALASDPTRKITLFTVGMLQSSDGESDKYMDTLLASQTSGGQYVYAGDISNIEPVMNQIANQVQKNQMNLYSNRFNVDFSI